MDINYDDYERTREEIIAKSMDKSYFTKEYFEKLQKTIKKEEEFENKITKLAEEYFTIISDNLSIENVKDFNKIQYGFYAILEYCLKQIKTNDKNLTVGLDKGENDES